MNQPTFLVIDLFCGFGGTTHSEGVGGSDGKTIKNL
jgi:hypothetical protein